MGIKETRQQLFNAWNLAIVQEEWGRCDSLMTLILHTLPEDKPGRNELEHIINKIQEEYKKEWNKLQELIRELKNQPFKKEDLKVVAMTRLCYWRANELHNAFIKICKTNEFITEEEQIGYNDYKTQH